MQPTEPTDKMHDHDEDTNGMPPFPTGFMGYPGPGPGGFDPSRLSTEQVQAKEIVSLAMQVPGWAIGAVVRRVQRELREYRREQRALILEPNRDSDLKVERYNFAANAMIDKLGTEQAISGSNSPDVNFRAQRVTTNIEHPAMVLIVDGRVANVSFTVGGQIDAWMWGPHAVGQELDLPTLTPANKASFDGRYTGRVPLALQDLDGKPYMVVMAFTGPATIVA